MQDPPASATNSTPGVGAHELGRAGLARFRSAPATSWLDALLEDDDPLKLSGPGPLTQLLTSPGPGPSGRPTTYVEPAADPGLFAGGGGCGPQQQQEEATQQNVAFHRMNSSPAEFLAGTVDGYFSSSFGMPGSYDYAGASLDGSPSSSSGKRLRDAGRGEQGGLLDMDMEKLLEDTVPCRVRAKRGCATHPRSIAERVRRTKISDRIRKLQELVPNMDKQTNTADMLEEAVEYVKNLQRQIQELTEQKKRCKCAAKS